MERQHLLFDESRSVPRAARRTGARVRHHRPRRGEAGVPLTAVQVDLVDLALEALAGEEALRGRTFPVRVGDVLYLPRDVEIVDALMRRLDDGPGRDDWRRPADRLAQDLHEWWVDAPR